MSKGTPAMTKARDLHPRLIDLDMPERVRRLPRDARGYPVPWFVTWFDGKPDFRVADAEKVGRAYHRRLCWTCGDPLGRWFTFVIGPMCAVNRVSSEPPSHHSCARFAARGCPFLALPKAERRENNLPDGVAEPPGIFITRNPGVTALWTTHTYKPFNASNSGVLFEVGEPKSVEWFALGRAATRAEVMHSIETGMPTLLELCTSDEGRDELHAAHRDALTLLPQT